MQIVNDRRALHRIPELDRCLPKTMEYLKSSLSSLKCRLFSPIEDSLCAFFDFGKADAIAKILPIYDNLERALNQPCTDEAYKKGVELTMTELKKIFDGLGVEIYGEIGEAFNPELHNAVMHNEDESLGENVISMVFQKGFKMGDKVVRFAMVQVAN